MIDHPGGLEQVLCYAGWEPGRKGDTSGWREPLVESGFAYHDAAEAFLAEFGGLVFRHGGDGITRRVRRSNSTRCSLSARTTGSACGTG
ncbi:SUKH-3 domain-containing protein [Saccharothrix isguenensis]